jgi:hypothetical protein
MIKALATFMSLDIDARRPPKNRYQVKVSDDVCFYPDTGRIVRDGGAPMPVSGIDALIKFLRDDGQLSTTAAA